MALWVPTGIAGKQLWVDPSDPDNITLDGSGNYEVVSDKSGLGRHYSQATAGSRPLADTTTFARQALGLDGARWLQNTVNPPSTVAGATAEGHLFAVLSRPAAGIFTFPLGHLTDDPGYPYTWYSDNNQYVDFGGNNASVPMRSGSTDSSTGKFLVVTSRDDGIRTLRRNGTGITLSFSIGTNGRALQAIGRRKSNEVMTGALGEMLLFDVLLDIETVQKIEGYLAHRWGTQDVLDAGHPYKDGPPIAVSIYGFVRDKFGVLAEGRDVYAIKEVNNALVDHTTTDAGGGYEVAVTDGSEYSVTAATTTTLTDAAQAWTPNEFQDHFGARVISGDQSGEWRRISSNTSDTITVSTAFPGAPAIGDTFEIAPLHTVVFSGEPERNSLVYSGVMPG